MKTYVGIDLGSTTTKAVVLDDQNRVIGRGITNSRSNYGTAARVASEEARIDGRFTLFRRALAGTPELRDHCRAFSRRSNAPSGSSSSSSSSMTWSRPATANSRAVRFDNSRAACGEALDEVFQRLRAEAPSLYAPGAKRKSDFFRDIAGSRYHAHAEEVARDAGCPTSCC